jgi:hypothetical protein
MKTFLENNVVILHSGAVAAGQTLITPTTGVDTAGYERATFIVCWGTIDATGVQSPELHQCDTLAGTYAALTGTNITVGATDDDKISVLEIYRPVERYLKCLVNRATANSEVDAIICILSEGTATATADATVSGSEQHETPAEGAA